MKDNDEEQLNRLTQIFCQVIRICQEEELTTRELCMLLSCFYKIVNIDGLIFLTEILNTEILERYKRGEG